MKPKSRRMLPVGAEVARVRAVAHGCRSLATSATVCGLLLAACGLLPAGYAQCPGGQCAPNAAAHPSVVRVVNAVGRQRAYGSGTVVESDAQRGVVLTCAHLFSQGAGDVAVLFADGRRSSARLLAADRAWDLAALDIAPPQAAAVPIAAEPPRPGDALWSCGYGPDGHYWCNRGQALGYVRSANTASYETLELSGSARQGDSGGPVLNQQGELVAVLWGTDGRMVGGTYCGRIRKFLSGVLGCGTPTRPNPAPQPAAPAPDALAPAPQRAAPAPPQPLDRLRQRIDKALELAAGLQRRVEQAETALGSDNLRGMVREVAAGILAERAPGLAAKVLPGLLAALGWTGPPALAAIVALRLGASLLGRRAARRAAPGAPKPPADRPPPQPLNDQYAEQLAGVYALSGRSPIADATLGREYDEELRQAAASSDANLARWANRLRSRVARRFYRIHGESPLPAEPLETNP